jgi:AraC-like DNA-binding protein
MLVLAEPRWVEQIRVPELEATVVADWLAARSVLLQRPAPAVFVISSTFVNERTQSEIALLCEGGKLPPTIVFFTKLDVDQMQSIWGRLATHGVVPAFDPARLTVHVRKLITGTPRGIALYLMREFSISPGSPGARLLSLLESNETMQAHKVMQVARRLGMARTTLYQELSRAGLPTVEDLQILFRLVTATSLISTGSDLDEAAARAHFSDARSLRRSLKNRLGVAVRDLRQGCPWQDVVSTWVRRKANPANPANARAVTYGTSSEPNSRT